MLLNFQLNPLEFQFEKNSLPGLIKLSLLFVLLSFSTTNSIDFILMYIPMVMINAEWESSLYLFRYPFFN